MTINIHIERKTSEKRNEWNAKCRTKHNTNSIAATATITTTTTTTMVVMVAEEKDDDEMTVNFWRKYSTHTHIHVINRREGRSKYLCTYVFIKSKTLCDDFEIENNFLLIRGPCSYAVSWLLSTRHRPICLYWFKQQQQQPPTTIKTTKKKTLFLGR